MAGLRERQRTERGRSILSAARKLFKERGYRDTTMAAIAELAEVSTVTVFNYYKTKGELLLALIAQENDALATRFDLISADLQQPALDSVCAFFEAVTVESFSRVDRAVWRQVIASSILIPASEFGHAYTQLRSELKNRFCALLKTLEPSQFLVPLDDPDALANLLYSYHYQLFTALVADDRRRLSAYRKQLRSGLSPLFRK